MANDERPTSAASTDEDWFTELRPQRDPSPASSSARSDTSDGSSAYPPAPWLDGAAALDTGQEVHGSGGPDAARSDLGELPADDPFNSAPPMRRPAPTTDPAAAQPYVDPPTVTTSLPSTSGPGAQLSPAQPQGTVQPQRPVQPQVQQPPAIRPGADQQYGQQQYAAPPPPPQQAQPAHSPQQAQPAGPAYQSQQNVPQQDHSFDGQAAYRPAAPQQPQAVPPHQAPASPPQQAQPALGQHGQQPYPQALAPSYGQPHAAQGAPQSQPMPLPDQVPARPLPTSSDLTPESLVKPDAEVPDGGWRRAIFKMSGGSINPGRSKEETEREDLISRIRTPIRGCRRIAVVSLKGGIGKTTTTSCLGLTLAHYRGDRVVALDANPDAGTLAERLTGVTDVSVRDLLDNIEHVDTFTEISRYMSLAQRLQVLASDQDPEVSEAFDAQQYRQVTGLLSRYYNVILTDSGTGMLHSAMQGTLEAADALVVVGAPSVDGSSRASKTLDWLIAHGYEDLVRNSVAVISSVRERTNDVDMSILRNHFNARCRAVVEIPFDPHLVVGGPIDLAKIKPSTSTAYLELAATVADGFHT